MALQIPWVNCSGHTAPHHSSPKKLWWSTQQLILLSQCKPQCPRQPSRNNGTSRSSRSFSTSSTTANLRGWPMTKNQGWVWRHHRRLTRYLWGWLLAPRFVHQQETRNNTPMPSVLEEETKAEATPPDNGVQHGIPASATKQRRIVSYSQFGMM